MIEGNPNEDPSDKMKANYQGVRFMEKEIIFVVQESDEGGYLARALEYPIFSEGDTLEEIRDAVRCHFDPGNYPKVIRLLSAITPDNLYEEVDTGKPVGREVW